MVVQGMVNTIAWHEQPYLFDGRPRPFARAGIIAAPCQRMVAHGHFCGHKPSSGGNNIMSPNGAMLSRLFRKQTREQSKEEKSQRGLFRRTSSDFSYDTMAAARPLVRWPGGIA
jgi:hypothetical protein